MTKSNVEYIDLNDPDAAERLERVVRENQEIFDALVRPSIPATTPLDAYSTGVPENILPPMACNGPPFRNDDE